MESLMNKFNNFTSFSQQPSYKQTSAYFTPKITNTVTDEVSDCIGIDFGNSNICVSYYKNQIFHVFQLGTQSSIMPAWLTFNDKEFFIGGAAKNTQHNKSTKITVFDIRRALSSYPISAPGLSYHLKNDMIFEQNNVSIPLVRVIAILFTAIKDKLEKALNEGIKSVVLTIPTNFDIKQQQILVDACQIANLKVLKLLYEPVATAITYYSLKKTEKKAICIIDFGGGKLDVANFLIEDGRIELLHHATDLELGGRDFDERLVSYVIDIVKKKYPNANLNDRIISGIREKCIAVKESFISCTQKNIELEIGDEDITINVKLADFEKLCDDLFKRAQSLITRVIAQIDKTRLSDVVLVGGSSRMPKFQSDVQQLFPNIPFNLTLNADEAIAKGACMYGASKEGLIKKLKIEDKIPWKGKSLQKPKMKTFVDENGIVQQKVVEDSVNRNTDIEHEKNEIKKMFQKQEETTKDYKEEAKANVVEDSSSALIATYLNPEFAKHYQRQGYDIIAIKAFEHYFQQNYDQAAKAQIINYFIKRIEICLTAIELYQKWVPGRFSQLPLLEHEVKKLCLNSASMDANVLETNIQYLNLVRFYIEKRYEIHPYYNINLNGPLKTLLEKIKNEFNILRTLLENFHRTNQRVNYDIQPLSDSINTFLQNIRR